MDELTMTDEQILEIGFKVLVDKLGPIGMIRFIHQFEAGTGNYTEDRYQWLDVSDVETLGRQIQQAEDNVEYTFYALRPIIEQSQDNAEDYNSIIKNWSDWHGEENPSVDLETEGVDPSNIIPFQIDNQIQEFATPVTD